MKKLNKKTFTENSLEAYAVCCAYYSCNCTNACKGIGQDVTKDASNNTSYNDYLRLQVTPYA